MAFRKLKDEKYFLKREGVEIKDITGNYSQLTVVKLAPGFKSSHSHIHEQIGYILSGEVLVSIGDQTEILSKGDGYFIPSLLPHAFEVIFDYPVEYIEFFSPPKEENMFYSSEDG